jgi:hypothetical protein
MLRSHSRKVAYARNIRDSRYLYLILLPVTRFIGTGPRCALKSGPYQDALRPKPSDKHALVLVCIILSNRCKILVSGNGDIDYEDELGGYSDTPHLDGARASQKLAHGTSARFQPLGRYRQTQRPPMM